MPRVGSGQFDKPLQQHRLVDPGQCEKVALDGRLDDCAKYVVAPARLVTCQAGGARVTPEVEIGGKVETECRRHLRERPVGNSDRLETPGEALTQPRLHAQRRGTQDHDVQWAASGAVGIPESLDGF